MGCKTIRYPRVEPVHSDGGVTFSAELPVPDGVIMRFQIDLRGTLVATTAVGADSPFRLVQQIRIEFPRVGLDPYVIQASLRDLARAAELLNAMAGQKAQPTSAIVTSALIDLPLFIPGRPALHPWGIDTRELNGQILVSGTWANAAQYGTATTAFTAGELRINLCVTDDIEQPRFALLPVGTRIGVDSASNFKKLLAKAELDAAFAVMIRTLDSSAALAADRVDGLFTRVKLHHSADGTLLDANVPELRGHGQAAFRVPNDELTAALPNGYAGLFAYDMNPEGFPGSYPDLVGADIEIEIDAETPQTLGVTNVVPAAGDAVFATLLGVQANDMMLQLIDGGGDG